MKKISLGFSPCPNDTFMFDAMVHHKIDTEDLEFELFMHDVELLNQKAFSQSLDVTKISFHAFAFAVENYVLLNSGSALGFGVGPLLIGKNKIENPLQIIKDQRIAIPGKFTTANFLLGLALPQAQNKTEILFSKIEEDVLNGIFDFGLIIHESRFTFQERGLVEILDLGDFWQNLTNLPLPLGGIVIKRDLDLELQLKIQRVLKRSIVFAFDYPESGIEFIRQNAAEMDEEVMYKHINLYVNKYSLDLGEEGKLAIQTLFKKANELSIIPKSDKSLFLN